MSVGCQQAVEPVKETSETTTEPEIYPIDGPILREPVEVDGGTKTGHGEDGIDTEGKNCNKCHMVRQLPRM